MSDTTPFDAAVEYEVAKWEAMIDREITPEFRDSIAAKVAPEFVEEICKDASRLAGNRD